MKSKYTLVSLKHDLATLNFKFNPERNLATHFQVEFDEEQIKRLVSKFSMWKIIKLKWKYRKDS